MLFRNRTVWVLFLVLLGAAIFSLWRLGTRKKPIVSTVSTDISRLATVNNIVPVAVIGSGPAGLSAALYAARAKMYTVVFAGSQPGGQLTTTTHVENWPGIPKNLGPSIMKGLKKQVQDFGAVYVQESIIAVDFNQWPFVLTTENGTKINALSVIIATGASPRKLGVPGEQEYWGKGVTTCAICDAPYYKDSAVVVVGGGDSAVEEAIQLSAYANDITILVRSGSMRAAPTMQERLEQYPHIKIRYHTQVTKIIGNGGHVTGVEIIDNTRQTEQLATQGVFLAIGHEPNTQLFKPFLSMNERGYITTFCPTQKTSLKGIFAAGDVTDEKYRQAGVAAGDGIKAGLDAVSFLQEIGFNDAVARSIERNYFELIKTKDRVEIPLIETKEQFEQQVLKAVLPVIVDFYAEWCTACTQMMPLIKSTAQTLKDKISFVKIDVDKASGIADQYFIRSLPSLLLFKDGVVIGRYHWAKTKEELYNFIEKSIDQKVSP